MSKYITVEMRLESLIRPDLSSQVLGELFLILMAQSLAPYIHVILADIVSIT